MQATGASTDADWGQAYSENWEKRCCGRTGERTPLVPLQACAGWAKTVNCHAHPRILLPQNRCLPEPLAAPFPHQPEPRCNTLDFAGKVVCQRAFRRSLDSSRQGTGKWGCPDENGGWYTFTNPERCVIIVPSTNGREGGGCSALQELTCWSRSF